MKSAANRIPYLLLLPVLSAFVLVVNLKLVEGSSIASADALAWDLLGQNQAPPEWPDQWMWHQEAPYKYRILGKLPVWLTWRLFLSGRGPQGFLISFIAWAWIWLTAALFALRGYLADLRRNDSAGEPRPGPALLAGKPGPLLGVLLFALSPPILFAFKFPVHSTPNDFLEYFLVLLAMLALLRGRPGRMSLLSCLAVFCRETSLLVPLTYLLVADGPWRRRLLWSLAPVLCWILLRLAWWEAYNPVAGGLYNLGVPLESLGFLFLVFGPLWLLLLPGRRLAAGLEPGWGWSALGSSFPWIAIAALAITLGLARVREIRILFILFPFVVPFCLAWFSAAEGRIRQALRSVRYWAYVLACLLLLVFLRLFLVAPDKETALAVFERLRHFYGGYGGGWLSIGYAYLLATLAAAPLVLARGRTA
jgi:hypothetical protein